MSSASMPCTCRCWSILVDFAMAKASPIMNSDFARELVHDLRHDAGAIVEAVAQRGIAMNEDALPRHQHVVEDRHRIGLVEARRERVIEQRGGVLVDHRRAADESPTGRVDSDA